MKKSKRIIALLLTLVMFITFLPMQTQAASPKLSKTKITIYVGDSVKLVVKNNKKTVKWSSSNHDIAGVYNGTVYGNGVGTATITAKVGSKKLKCKVTVKESDTMKVQRMYDWLVSDIWNEGFCDISYYYEGGTDACGEKMDISYALSKFEKSYSKMSEYDSIVNSFKGTKYDKLKEIWSLFKPESEKVYNTILSTDWNNAPYGEELDMDYLRQYINDLFDCLLDLYY